MAGLDARNKELENEKRRLVNQLRRSKDSEEEAQRRETPAHARTPALQSCSTRDRSVFGVGPSPGRANAAPQLAKGHILCLGD